jgi:hypothetical protein
MCICIIYIHIMCIYVIYIHIMCICMIYIHIMCIYVINVQASENINMDHTNDQPERLPERLDGNSFMIEGVIYTRNNTPELVPEAQQVDSYIFRIHTYYTIYICIQLKRYFLKNFRTFP